MVSIDKHNPATGIRSRMSQKETVEMMESRHKKETEELAEKAAALRKSAKKNTKAQIESQIIQMEFDLKAKHYNEEEDLESGDADDVAEVAAVEPSTVLTEAECKPLAETSVESKKAKAKRKQEKKAQKESDRIAEKQLIAESAGPSQRELELERIHSSLKKIGCEIKPIVSDGNCLYRCSVVQYID